MSKRLQVVMDDAEYDEIQDAADAQRLTVSAWVRQILRAARAPASNHPTVPGVPGSNPVGGTSPGGALGAEAEASPDRRSSSRPPGVVAGAVRTPSPTPGTGAPSANQDLVRLVMARHGLSSPAEALDFALRTAAEPPFSRGDLLALRGTGWAGEAATLRAGSDQRTPPDGERRGKSGPAAPDDRGSR